MPQGVCRVIYSGAPFRPSRVRGRKLLTHPDFPPTPPPVDDGFGQLEREIAAAEVKLEAMRDRLATLRQRVKRRRKPAMASIEIVKPTPVPVPR